MKIEKLEQILNSGFFHSDISLDVELALKAKIEKASKKIKNDTKIKPMLDFDEINKEAIKFSKMEVKYPQRLPKGVVISVRKKSFSSTL